MAKEALATVVLLELIMLTVKLRHYTKFGSNLIFMMKSRSGHASQLAVDLLRPQVLALEE